MLAILKKEFKHYFLSPMGYVYIGVFLLVYSFVFYNFIFLQQSNTLSYLFNYWPILLLLPLMISILTMRSFAEERKTGTEQLLLTSSTSVTKIVLGKFFAAASVVVITNLLFFIYFIILSCFGNPEFMTTLVSVFGFILLLLSFVAFGIFASSLVENQIIAAILSIIYISVAVFLPQFVTAAEFLSPTSAFFNSFSSGTIGIADLVLILSYTVMFIIFTIMVIQRRKNIK